MPSVKILRNIGTVDSATLGLDPNEAREGRTLSVSQEVCDELIRCGLAEFHQEGREAPHQEARQQRQQQRQ